MSTAPLGPGWWQASDGRWYAPELHPSRRAPSPAATPTPGQPPSTGRAASPPLRRSRTVPALVALIVVLVAAGVAVYFLTKSSSSNAFASRSANQIASAAQSAARHVGSVTITNHAIAPTGRRTIETQVSTNDTGSQRFGTATTSFQNLCVPGTCYVRGSASGLEQAFRMPAALAVSEAGHWLALPAASSTPTEVGQYDTVFAATTLSSLLARDLVPSGLRVVGTTTVDGQPVVELHGAYSTPQSSVREVGTWYVRVDAPHLLLKSVGTATDTSGTASFTSIYTDWGRIKPLSAPATSTPFPITYEK